MDTRANEILNKLTDFNPKKIAEENAVLVNKNQLEHKNEIIDRIRDVDSLGADIKDSLTAMKNDFDAEFKRLVVKIEEVKKGIARS